MLPPFIIEQIRKREEDDQRRREADQPRLELPLDAPYSPFSPPERRRSPESDEVDRGVVILELA